MTPGPPRGPTRRPGRRRPTSAPSASSTRRGSSSELAQRRAALPPAELAALEAEARARLVAAGTPAVALPLAVRVAVDQVLAAQAGLPVLRGLAADAGGDADDTQGV